jgi:acyl-CoA reductase-like NAD-dependent aldehyde dehydrogenase
MDTIPANEQGSQPELFTAKLVEQARQAQTAWATCPLRERLAKVNRLRGLLTQRADHLCQLAREELGKAPQDTLSADLLTLAEACKYLKARAGSILASRRVSPLHNPWIYYGAKIAVERSPRGVVGIIGTWNYPYCLAGVQMAQALVAGNAVVFKPSEFAHRCSALLVQLFLDAGFPAGVLQVLPHEREWGGHLAAAGIDHVVFTGSLPVGRLVAKAAADHLATSTLELSGCDPLLALDDADPELVARSAWFGAVVNQGQTCVATRRVIGTRPFLKKVEGHLAELVQGVEPFTLVRPAEGVRALELAREATSQGARLIGGVSLEADGAKGCPPLVLADVTPAMRVAREALFAPVLSLVSAESEADLVTVERGSPLCLGASVFSARPERALALAAQLRSPNIAINEVVIPLGHPATPIVARGASGWGSTQGDEGLLELTVPRVIFQGGPSPGSFRPHLDLVPQGDKKAADMSALLQALLNAGHHPSWWGRLQANLSLPAQAWRWWRNRG